jgi:hypothetical protein
MRFLCPIADPPSRADYDELYAQFVALILSTDKTEARVPHSIRHPMTNKPGKLIVAKEVDDVRHQTIYTIVQAPD